MPRSFTVKRKVDKLTEYLSLREFCLLCNRYSLTDNEIEEVISLPLGFSFENNDLIILRIE